LRTASRYYKHIYTPLNLRVALTLPEIFITFCQVISKIHKNEKYYVKTVLRGLVNTAPVAV
jgi:hypothetical protein